MEPLHMNIKYITCHLTKIQNYQLDLRFCTLKFRNCSAFLNTFLLILKTFSVGGKQRKTHQKFKVFVLAILTLNSHYKPELFNVSEGFLQDWHSSQSSQRWDLVRSVSESCINIHLGHNITRNEWLDFVETRCGIQADRKIIGLISPSFQLIYNQ